MSDFATLGADVLGGTREQPAPYQNSDFVLTRLHARYGKTITNDLVFKETHPISGGREHTINQQGKLEEGAQKSDYNNFQARYAIRYPWTGPIACDAPVRGRWGGPPDNQQSSPTPATKLAFAPRGEVELPTVIKTDIPELGLKAASKTIAAGGGFDPRPGVKKKGCGCAASDSGGLLFGGLVFAFALRRRRPASRARTLKAQ